MTKTQKYYPWVIMLSCCCILGITMGVGTNCNGIFMGPVADELGIGRGDVSIYVTVMGIASGLASPFVGRMIGKVDIRKMLTMSAVLTGCGFFLLSRINSLFQYSLCGVLVGVGVSLGAFMTMTVLLNNWFVKNVGLVTGITMSSSSLAGILMNPVLSRMIEANGWRSAYQLMGWIILSTLPVIWLLIRMTPEEKGSEPWGVGTVQVRHEQVEGVTDDTPLGAIIRGKSYLLLMAFALVSSFFVNHISHFQGIAMSAGFSAATGAAMISAAQTGEFSGKLMVGWLSDRFGAFRAFLTVATLGIVGLIGLLFVGEGTPALFALACALLYGPMTAVGSVGYSLIIKNMYGIKTYPKVYPYISIASTASFSVGFPAIGYIYDLTGSYDLSFILTIFGIMAAVLLLGAAMGEKMGK